jgi:ribonuclease-3
MSLIDQAATVLDYRFGDVSLLNEALTHASSAGDRLQSNERMEFLGDAILGFVVCEHLYYNYPDLLEGELTKIKSAVVSRRVCAKISDATGLAELLNLGKGMEGRPGVPHSVAAAVFESVVAAIYLDGGIEPTRQFILNHLKPYIDEAATSAHQQNFKSVLQQYAQKALPDTPSYVLLKETGPDHAKAFQVCVEMSGHRHGAAWASSKKEAEQKAALVALADLGLAEIGENDQVVLHDPSQSYDRVSSDVTEPDEASGSND